MQAGSRGMINFFDFVKFLILFSDSNLVKVLNIGPTSSAAKKFSWSLFICRTIGGRKLGWERGGRQEGVKLNLQKKILDPTASPSTFLTPSWFHIDSWALQIEKEKTCPPILLKLHEVKIKRCPLSLSLSKGLSLIEILALNVKLPPGPT